MTGIGGQPRDVVREQFGKVRRAFLAVAVLSCAVNLLMLTGPMFMLQVYDRVLTSQSVPTLVVLLGFAIALYAMMGLFDFFRTRVLSRVSYWLDDALAPLSFRSWMVRGLSEVNPGYRPVLDLTTMRGFISSPTILALFDLPWFPLYLAVVFFLHFHLGLLATAGAVVVIVLALCNEWLTSRASGTAAQAEIVETRFADEAHKSAESVLSMGMVANTTRAWRGLRNVTGVSLQNATERSEMFTASSKAFRLLLQSAILGLGAYLAIHQEITPGMIIAASIIAGRALAPMDQTIGGWRMIKRANLSRKRLRDYLVRDAQPIAQGVELPEPQGFVSVSGVLKARPRLPGAQDSKPILAGIDFDLEPGEGLGVIGPSASGKSSLARLLVGLWMPDQGSVRLDGATFDQWDTDKIGPHIGYLPQEISLLSGTIAQNISRFEPEPDDEEVVEAARLAGVHDMILAFPEGYGTNVDDAVSPLTGGQKQRIGLARAIYRKPVLVVLDEPNSNLDALGDQALANTISTLRALGSVVVVMAHRPSAIASVDKILMLNEGQMMEFGEKADVLRKVTRAA